MNELAVVGTGRRGQGSALGPAAAEGEVPSGEVLSREHGAEGCPGVGDTPGESPRVQSYPKGDFGGQSGGSGPEARAWHGCFPRPLFLAQCSEHVISLLRRQGAS